MTSHKIGWERKIKILTALKRVKSRAHTPTTPTLLDQENRRQRC